MQVIFFPSDLECLHRDKRGIVRVSIVLTYHTLFWVGVQGGVYFFLASGGGLRVGTGLDPEGGYRVGTVSKKNFSKWP